MTTRVCGCGRAGAERRLALVFLLGAAICTGCARAGAPQPRWATDPVYDLRVRVLPDAHRLEVDGTLRLPPAAAARSRIVLSMSRRMDRLSVQVGEPAYVGGPVSVERLASDEENVRWSVRLAQPVPAGEPLTLEFSAAGDGGPATLYSVGPEVAFASAWGTRWYPVLDGGPESELGTITVSVPPGWSAATGGEPRSTEAEEVEGVFRSTMARPTHFSFAAGPYTVLRREGRPALSVRLLTSREHIDAYLQGVGSMLDVLADEFGPFPLDVLTIVEVPREKANEAGFNAFSAPGLLVLNHRAFDAPETKYVLEWLGHELAHQWFPHVVSLRQPPGRYMTEALAEYGGMRIVEEIGGPAAAKTLRTSGFEYDPIYSAREYFKLVGAGADQPLDDLGPTLEDRNLAYNKGALVFGMLSRELGRSRFRRILHDLTATYRFRQLGWHEFLEAIEDRAHADLDWFYDQWFRRSGAPDFQLSWVQRGDTLRGSILQPEPYYAARLSLKILGFGEEALHTVEVAGPSTEFAVSVGFTADSVVLDPDFEVLRWTPEYRALADSIRSSRRTGG